MPSVTIIVAKNTFWWTRPSACKHLSWQHTSEWDSLTPVPLLGIIWRASKLSPMDLYSPRCGYMHPSAPSLPRTPAAVETAMLHIQINLANAELCYFHTGLVRDCILTFIMNFQIHWFFSNIFNQSTHFSRIQGGNIKKEFLDYYLWEMWCRK